MGVYYFKELAEDYLSWAQRQKAFIRKRGIINLLLDFFGNISIRQFNTKIVEEYQTKVLGDGKAPATINKHLSVLKYMLKKAVEWEMVDEATLASRLVMAGVDITTVKELLGHKSLTMTLRYAHLAPSHKVKSVEILDMALNKKPTIQKLYSQAHKNKKKIGFY